MVRNASIIEMLHRSKLITGPLHRMMYRLMQCVLTTGIPEIENGHELLRTYGIICVPPPV